MKINYLKINNFGKLKNKEINLNKKINLIYGKNEAGKTTLLKFITSMFYGVSKNKNGKDISDFDRYMPWNNEEFSGKIRYELDNENTYEVFRDFNKKNPKIYNNNLEDISKEYNMDKTKGNQFFYDQTKIDEFLFLSTTIAEQQNVVLNENVQNILVQKITNRLSSGEDNISYNKVMEKLSKELIEEVGTERTSGRPINNIIGEINNIENEISLLEEFNDKNTENKNKKELLKKEIESLNNKLTLIKEIKNIKEKEILEKEKIKINNKIKEEYNDKIINLNKKINNMYNVNNLEKKEVINNKRNNKKRKISRLNIVLIPLLIILNILINIFNISKICEKIIAFLTVIYLTINLILFIVNKIKLKKINNINNLEKEKINNEINILKENMEKTEKEINNINNKLLKEKENNKQQIKNKFFNKINEKEIINLFNKELMEIDVENNLLENNINNKKIELNTLQIHEENINNKLENYSEYKEKLNFLYKEKENILSLERSINLAKKSLENAYYKIKNEITPKFTKNLSKTVEKISNGKYKNVKFNSDEGLKVELENGEYINANRLSIGTIEQLYLSLRLSSTQEITGEKMPIILDESFAYYDDERLENIFKYISENYIDNQIIIFTCSNREKSILNKLNINYNLIEI